MQLARSASPGASPVPNLSAISLLHRRWLSDRVELGIIVVSVLSSIANFLFYLLQGHVLEYVDSISHQMIARRVLDSPTPGLSQIGGVWLPLPHLLSLPFIWNDWFYFSGVAGSFLSMISYVVVVLFVYRIARLLGCNQAISIIAAGIVAFNPNMRYMQSISMTELPLLAGIVLATYFLIRWSRDESISAMIGLIAAVLLASSTRYEGWPLLGAAFLVIVYVTIRRGWSWARRIDYSLYYLAFAGLFIPLWSIWNKVIIQTGWLGFKEGEYAVATNWVTATEPSTGHPWIAIKTYWFAMSSIAGEWMLLLAAGGLGCFLLRDRLDPKSAGVLILAFPAPFYAFMLWAGERPLHVPQITGDIYNVRFALQMAPMVALMAALLVQTIFDLARRSPLRQLVIAGAVMGAIVLTPATAITLTEPIAARQNGDLQSNQRAVGTWIAAHYPGKARVLMQTIGNEVTLFYSRLPLDQVIYEGINIDDLWAKALTDPGEHVDWIVMRVRPGAEDKVAQAMAEDPARLDLFTLVFQTDDIRIYVRTAVLDTAFAPEGGN